jgi:hypothetical protein
MLWNNLTNQKIEAKFKYIYIKKEEEKKICTCLEDLIIKINI